MKMKSKAILSLAASIAAGVVSAGTFKWTVSMNDGVEWDGLSCRIFAKDNSGIYLDAHYKSSATWFTQPEITFSADGAGQFTKDGATYDIGYLRFGFYSGSTYLGNTSKIGYEYAGPTGGVVSWEEVLGALQSGGTFTTDIRKQTSGDWVNPGPSIGTFSITPEPTSGLMLLLGAGMLALRRKRVQA